MPTPKKEAPFKIPKSLADVTDLAYSIRQERYAKQKEVEALQAKETMLIQHLIDNLPKSNATGISGGVANAKIVPKQVVKVEDWDAFYKFIVTEAKKDPGAWSLLQKRVGETAVKGYWENKKKVPGVKPEEVKTVSLTKVGS